MGQLGYGMHMKTGQPVILARGKHVINDKYCQLTPYLSE